MEHNIYKHGKLKIKTGSFKIVVLYTLIFTIFYTILICINIIVSTYVEILYSVEPNNFISKNTHIHFNTYHHTKNYNHSKILLTRKQYCPH